MNHLYFGDCLQILKTLHHKNPQGFIDLIYIDPPFNSKRNYNVLFESIDLKDANAQKQAFSDTWSNVSYIDTINELAELDRDLHTFLKTLSNIRTSDSAVAYLSTMAIRMLYMHKVLKDTGSFYLHCDPTMSHYLKIICDLIFGEKNYRNEIVWHYGQRTDTHKSHFSRKHDIILLYAKSKGFEMNPISKPWNKVEFLQHRHDVKIDDAGREFIWTDGGKKGERYKRFVDDVLADGKPFDDVWDIPILNSAAKERLGYPTQKPQGLLERIIKASSNEGDLVADFFCGCGTTVAAAQALNRQWLGVDISHLAVSLIAKRLVDTYGQNIKHNYSIEGFPQDIGSAKELARNTDNGRFNFQDWVIEVLLNGVVNPKKVADGGYDGYLTFNITDKQKEFVLIEIKSGNVNVKNIREFIQVIEKQKAAIGLFVCFEEQITQPMLKEAKLAGNYHYSGTGYESDYDKVQVITIEQLMQGQLPKIPESTKTTFKTAQKSTKPGQASLGLFD